MLEGISEVNVQVVVSPLSGKVLWVEYVNRQPQYNQLLMVTTTATLCYM